MTASTKTGLEKDLGNVLGAYEKSGEDFREALKNGPSPPGEGGLGNYTRKREAFSMDLSKYGLRQEEFDAAAAALGREPNECERRILGVMWSEHCSYKSTKHLLRLFPSKGPTVVLGPGENAGIVDLGQGLGGAFKAESHNHPSAVEPYHGAATGWGRNPRYHGLGARPSRHGRLFLENPPPQDSVSTSGT